MSFSLLVHVGARRANAASSPVRRCLDRASERAPGSAKAKRPDCPAKVDDPEIKGESGFCKAGRFFFFSNHNPRFAIANPDAVPILLQRRSFRAFPLRATAARLRSKALVMSLSIEAEADGILDVADGHMHAAQAKWDRLTQSDLAQIRTKRDLVARIEERYSLPHEQAVNDVELWMSDKRFGTWTV
jgi:hypothetical protein